MRYAYLTCELLGRDLDSRLLIAANLIKRSIACIVGQQWSMFANAVGSEKAKLIASNILTFERANFAALREILAWTRATFPQSMASPC